MQRLRMWLAAGATLAMLAASGPTFAHGLAGGAQGQTQGNGGVKPPQVQPWHQGQGGSRRGAAPGRPGGRGTFRAGGGAAGFHPAAGGRRGFLPPLRRYRPAPPATCYTMTTVAGTVTAVYGGDVSLVEAGGQTVTLPLAPNAVVTQAGVPVPASALAPGESVDVTVTCQGWASAVSIAG